MIFFRSKHTLSSAFFFFLFLIWLLLTFCVPTLSLATEKFPVYPCIKANVKFWENIYSRYSTRQGLLHDSYELQRVYAIVDLLDWQAPFSARINSWRIKAAKAQIHTILTQLGSGMPPRTVEERRIAGLFSTKTRSAYHGARKNIRLQVGQSDRFYEGLLRSKKYLPQFRQIFLAEGLPPELAYLPHVESSFNPKALSKAGAAGLWQFTLATGKEYMTINNLVDERYDPSLSARAAARLLKENYRQLHTWPLALTAYNYGRNGMKRAVRDKGSYEHIFTSYNQGAFKFASRNFYSGFLAAMRVAMRRDRSPLAFVQQEARLTLRLKKDMPISRLQASLGVSAEQFALLNPALRPAVLDGKKAVPRGYLVRLPATKRHRMRFIQ